MTAIRTAIWTLVFGALLPALPAAAQPLGSFRWQLQPYCNVITVAVVQQGGQYQLDGTDDQCGAAQAAGVRGLAFQNPNGSIGFGLAIVTAPGGIAVHVDATISIATLSGTWRDSAGNNGTFIFTPGAGTGGGPRPVPSGGIAPASITNIQIANNAVTSANVVNGSLTTADLQAPPKVGFAFGTQDVALTVAPVVVRTVTLTVPGPGTVIATAGGSFDLFTSPAADAARCSLTTGTTVNLTRLIVGAEGSPLATAYPLASTQAFSVTAGTFSVNLVCETFSGAPRIRDSSLVLTFIGS